MDYFTAIFQSPDGFLRSKPVEMYGPPPLEIRRPKLPPVRVQSYDDGDWTQVEAVYTIYRLDGADPYSFAYFYTEVPSSTRAPKPAHRGIFEITIEPA